LRLRLRLFASETSSSDDSFCVNGWFSSIDEPEKPGENVEFGSGIAMHQLKWNAATPNKLIARLCNHELTEPTFTELFFLTFSSFLSPEDLLDAVCARFSALNKLCKKAKGHKEACIAAMRKTFAVLSQWLSEYWAEYDEHTLASLRRRIGKFSKSKSLKKFFEKSEIDAFAKSIDNISKRQVVASGELSEIMLRSDVLLSLNKEGKYAITDFHAIEVARQLCLMEHSLFAEINHVEYLEQSWNKEGKEKKAPRVLRLIENFNKRSSWVQTEILLREHLKQRSEVLALFIDVAHALLDCNNFNSAMWIVAGLQSSAVSRLKQTWDAVGAAARQRLDEINRLIAVGTSNFKAMRERLASCEPPCIPYIGMYLIDLTFIAEGNPKMIANMINVQRYQYESDVISRIRLQQRYGYAFTPAPFIQSFIGSAAVMESEKELYARSLVVEARGALPQSESRSALNYVKYVAKKTRRFREATLRISARDQDVMYIGDRVLAMGYPNKGRKMTKAVKFLEGAHHGHYDVYSFVSESQYPAESFHNRVHRFPIRPGSAPHLQMIAKFAVDAQRWLDKNPLNVIAAHCTHKRDRVGTMLACFLLADGRCLTGAHATQYLDAKFNASVEYSPSQLRYISYYEQLIKEQRQGSATEPMKRKLFLSSISMHTIPSLDRDGGCDPFFSVCQEGRQVYRTNSIRSRSVTATVNFDCGNTPVSGDVQIHFYHRVISHPIFSVSFHTGFLRDLEWKVFKRDVDLAHLDKEHSVFHQNFKLVLHFCTFGFVCSSVECADAFAAKQSKQKDYFADVKTAFESDKFVTEFRSYLEINRPG
jgi:son of sevenless-like protein